MKKITLCSFLTFSVLLFFSTSFAQNLNSGNQNDVPSFGLDPAYVAVNTPACVANPKFPADLAYGYSASTTTKGPVSYTLNNPGTLTLIADQTIMDFIAASSYANGVWYGATYNATNGSTFVTIDKTSGTRSILGLMGGKSVTGLAYDWTTNVMYALTYESSATKLNTVNLANGALTLVGNAGAFLGINLGCTSGGALYTVSVGTDELYSIDKTMGTGTAIGPIGFNANYAQDMEYDNSDGTMYFAAYNADNSPGQGELRTIDLATGATTLIGVFQGNAEVTGLCIANTTVGVENYVADNSVLVYPNPVKDQLTITAVGNGISKVAVLNSLGQSVFESLNADKDIVINTSNFERGLYFVVVETAKGKTTRKVAVE
ncbi:MAG: T9SS type A sorting domain-containing protein [Bacteroidales bacterium]